MLARLGASRHIRAVISFTSPPNARTMSMLWICHSIMQLKRLS